MRLGLLLILLALAFSCCGGTVSDPPIDDGGARYPAVGDLRLAPSEVDAGAD